MARSFKSFLHPRDKNGKFRSKGGGGSSSKKSRPRRRIVVGPKSYLGQVAAAKAKKSGKPLAEKGAKSEQLVAGVMTGVFASQGARVATAYGSAAVGAGARGHYAVAAAAAAKAGTSAASAANEVYRINTVTSKKFKGKTVKEQSKFHAASDRREKIINRADTAASIAVEAAVFASLAGPLIAQKAAFRRNNDRISRRSGIPQRPTPLKSAKRNRNGVYNISDVKGKRVA